jgi:uncharacterized protein (DUF433 family)
MAFDIGTLLDSDPGFWEGRPFIRGRRATVHRLAIEHNAGRSAEELARDFDLEVAQVYAALAYYAANRAAIDADLVALDEEERQLEAELAAARPGGRARRAVSSTWPTTLRSQLLTAEELRDRVESIAAWI